MEAYNTQRALKKIKRHPAAQVAMDVSTSSANVGGNANISGHQIDRVAKLKLTSNEAEPANQTQTKGGGDGNTGNFIGGPSIWYIAAFLEWFHSLPFFFLLFTILCSLFSGILLLRVSIQIC